VIEELLDTGDLVDPELTRPNQMDSGHFVGVGSRALKLEEEVFLLALRTEKPNRPNLDYIRELDRGHGTKVLSPFITKWFPKRFNRPGNFRKPNLVPLDKFKAENLLRHIDFCHIIDKFPHKSIFNFLDEKTRMPWHLKSVLIQQQDSWISYQWVALSVMLSIFLRLCLRTPRSGIPSNGSHWAGEW
jgi:hypothetical protein